MKIKYKSPESKEDSWFDLLDKALELSFSKSLELDPSKSHNYSESKSLLEEVTKRCTEAHPFFRYADLCEDYALKIDAYERSLAIESTSFAISKLVYFNSILDNLEEAKSWLDQLISLKPEDPYVKKFIFLKDTFKGNDGIFRNSLIPYDFDPVFYREAHKELGLRSNIEAIFHFLEYGKKELRDYKRPIDIPVVNIILFTQYYVCDEQTRNNIMYCLDKNINNHLIDEIVILYDQEDVEEYLKEIAASSNKIRIAKINERLTFKQWFDLSSQEYPKHIKVLANSDIYFDHTIDFLRSLDYREDILYSCSRLDLDESGNIVASRISNSENSPLINNYTSQDCWVFKEKLLPFNSDFMLGYENCDVFLKDNCLSSGCHYLNLFGRLNCIHVDRRPTKIRGKYEFDSGSSQQNSNEKANPHGDWLETGLAAIQEKDPKTAIELFRRSISLKPSASWPYIKLAAILDDVNEKINLLREAIKVDDNYWSHILLVRSFLKNQDQNEAIQSLSTLEGLVNDQTPTEVLNEISDLRKQIKYPKSKIYLRVHGNLFKRLKTINSFFSFAKENNKDLFVYWGEGFQWSSQKFEDLFEKVDISFMEKEAFEEHSSSLVDLYSLMNSSEMNEKELSSYLKQNSFNYFGDESIQDILGTPEPDNQFYQELIPKISLEQSHYVQEILNKFVPNDTIGLCFDDINLPTVSEEILKQIKENSSCSFFVCSNAQRSIPSLKEMYGEKIIFQGKNSDCEDPYRVCGDQSPSLIDLFLLASTSKIICDKDHEIVEIASKISGLKVTSLKCDNHCKIKNSLYPSVIHIPHQLGWQTPAFTEKQALINHEHNYLCPSNKLYIGSPWATLIDFIHSKFEDLHQCSDFYANNEVRHYLDNYMLTNGYDQGSFVEYETHTVCQHIFWEKLIGFWSHYGIKNVHASHLTSDFDEKEGIKFHPWFLVGSNTENPKRNSGMEIKLDKKYLCSFVGANTDRYRSSIRKKIKDLLLELNKKEIKKEIYFDLKNVWFYNDIVYESQIGNKEVPQSHLEQKQFETVFYNELLSESTFSLCPEGTGPNTIRLWESMSVGSIPVLFENNWARPKIEGLSWDDFSITLGLDQLEDMFHILNEIPQNKIRRMSINCINAYNSIRTRTCF